MSEFDHLYPGVREEFGAIVNQMRLKDPNRFQDVREFPLDNQRILVDAGMGEYFREAVYQSIGWTLEEARNIAEPMSDIALRGMQLEVSKRFARGDFWIAPGDLVAISGFGVITTERAPGPDDHKTTDENSDADKDEDYGDSFVLPMNDTRNAFGTVVEIRYDDYPYFSGETEELEGIGDLDCSEVSTIDHEGLLLVLKNLVVCDPEGTWGEIRDFFDEGFVPLPEGRLLIQKGFPRDKLRSQPNYV